MYPKLHNNYSDVVTVEICLYDSDCEHYIWLRSFDRRRTEEACHYFKW